MINIDPEAVGDWAERQGIPYSGYTDLARSRRCAISSANASRR
jgi:long-chain acyl-CoA synthetase